ncbi:MAG TPA: hypothetical protein EYP08_02295 [Pyrodictiaceae archaeon]|nr:hypothetical protein [Pyrodictiaceae archaeon]
MVRRSIPQNRAHACKYFRPAPCFPKNLSTEKLAVVARILAVSFNGLPVQPCQVKARYCIGVYDSKHQELDLNTHAISLKVLLEKYTLLRRHWP